MDASFSMALLLAVLSVSRAVSSLSVVKGEFGASVTLPCDGSAFRGTPEAQLDVLWQTSERKKVARYSCGDHSVGIHFEGRVTFPTERIRQGDFSINISPVTFRDEYSYECVWKGLDERGLNDVILYVLGPPIPKSVSVPVGDSVTLPCYGQINKQAPEESFVQWKRGDDLVLKHSSEEVAYGPKYEGRASVSSDWIQGNFSLSLRATYLCDSGVYQCSTDQNQNVTSVVLELKVLSVSHAVPSRSTFERTFGASVTLPCNGSAFWGTPEAQLHVLWRTSDGRKVTHYSGGIHTVGVRFEGRVTFPTERIGAGDFALTLGALAFGDEDSYLCVWSEGQGGEKLLSNVTLVILAPPFSNSTSVSAGDPVALPCYGHVTGRAPDDKLFVRWQKGGALILQLSNGEFTYGSMFTERASVSLDTVRRGNFTLSLSVTGPADEGTYECSAERSQTGTSLSLKVKDHHTSFIVEHGTTFNLGVPRVPVRVLFLKEDTDVLVCTALVDYAKCEADYHGRVRYEEGTLQLRDVKPRDEGRYTVRAIYNDIIVKEVRLEVTTALPEGLYGFTLIVSVCLLALVMWMLKCGPRQMLGVFKHCVNQMK